MRVIEDISVQLNQKGKGSNFHSILNTNIPIQIRIWNLRYQITMIISNVLYL